MCCGYNIAMISSEHSTSTMGNAIAAACEEAQKDEDARCSSNDDPKDSSAARCISLSHLDVSFGPEFTHQQFDGEWIRGYLPFRDALDSVNAHASHANHQDLATHELKIRIVLAPSCERCTVTLDTRRKQRVMSRQQQRLPDRRQQKRVKLTAAAPTTPAHDGDDDDSDVETSDGEDRTSACTAISTRPQRRMSTDEIVQRLQKALPPIVDTDCSKDYLLEPVGTVLQQWTTLEGRTFLISLAEASQAASYHSKLQSLALWYIETADEVDVTSDEGGGYWKVLYLFESIACKKYALVGYMTLFHFYSPFKKPKSGIVVRICQALVLPPYQRMGLGKKLLCKVHELVRESASADREIVELTVEDPGPGFTALRNRVDYELMLKSFDSSETSWLPDTFWKNVTPSDSIFFEPLGDAEAITAAAIGRVTPKQIQIAYELYRLNALTQDGSLMKRYRLMVKKRLLKAHREELGVATTKEARRELLGSLFDHVFATYTLILKKA
jgi:histone acetyltransferase 1